MTRYASSGRKARAEGHLALPRKTWRIWPDLASWSRIERSVAMAATHVPLGLNLTVPKPGPFSSDRTGLPSLAFQSLTTVSEGDVVASRAPSGLKARFVGDSSP